MKITFLPWRAATFLAAVLASFPAPSRASCGAAGCPVDVHGGERTAAGSIRLDVGVDYVDQDRAMIGRKKANVGEIVGHHDEAYTVSETRRVGFEIGLMSRWSAQAILPLVHREHRHLHHHGSGDEIEYWDLNGVGDLTLLNRLAVIVNATGKSHVSVIAGGVLPTGRERVANADGEEADPAIQPGKGATSLILGAETATALTATTLNGKNADFPLFLSSTYQWNGQGTDDYRVGNVWDINAGLAYPLLPKLAFLQQVNLRINKRDDRGQTFEEVEKTGGTFVFVSPGLQVTMAEGLTAYGLLHLPVYQRVNSIQLATDFGMTIGASYRFSAL